MKKIIKTITWRIIASGISFILVFYFTKEIRIATIYSIIEMIIKMIAYYIHEIIWEKNKINA